MKNNPVFRWFELRSLEPGVLLGVFLFLCGLFLFLFLFFDGMLLLFGKHPTRPRRARAGAWVVLVHSRGAAQGGSLRLNKAGKDPVSLY